MANIKYFSDVSGIASELKSICSVPNKEFAARWPGVKGFRFDGYQMQVGRNERGELVPVTRKIEFKSNPSLHECDAKCLNGKNNGKCECTCGGKNHGAGWFTGLLSAA
ncbi:hypothetical protein [Comamonas testosteroni]|uniref:hypothetical protein n=1 Tax=Comamonas testosteroni TaxID=285 RepID=UPI0005B3456D|nr:hypothetical protein [Comamonas testosteroni]